jgi:hypothetical protein
VEWEWPGEMMLYERSTDRVKVCVAGAAGESKRKGDVRKATFFTAIFADSLEDVGVSSLRNSNSFYVFVVVVVVCCPATSSTIPSRLEYPVDSRDDADLLSTRVQY